MVEEGGASCTRGGAGHGGSGVATAQPGCGGALLGLRRMKASGAQSSGREVGGITGLVGRGGGLDGSGRPVGQGRGVGRPAEPSGLNSVEKNSFRIKNWIFEYTKALEICRRRFRRNFEVGIFPKFF
jgi:hypothetical protein